MYPHLLKWTYRVEDDSSLLVSSNFALRYVVWPGSTSFRVVGDYCKLFGSECFFQLNCRLFLNLLIYQFIFDILWISSILDVGRKKKSFLFQDKNKIINFQQWYDKHCSTASKKNRKIIFSESFDVSLSHTIMLDERWNIFYYYLCDSMQ